VGWGEGGGRAKFIKSDLRRKISEGRVANKVRDLHSSTKKK